MKKRTFAPPVLDWRMLMNVRRMMVLSWRMMMLVALTVVFAACKKNGFLDQTVTSSLDETSTFTDSSNAMGFLNNIYSNIGFATDPRRFSGNGFAAGLEAACDEAEGPNAASTNGFI